MAEQDFRVVREHYGDRPYAVGEIRTADPSEVQHLVPRCLEPIPVRSKRAATPASKKPAAKAATPRKRKGN
jgi:hypothetical protein